MKLKTRSIFLTCAMLGLIFSLAIALAGCHPIYLIVADNNPSLQPSVTLEMHRSLTITPEALIDPQQLIHISTKLISETTSPVSAVVTMPIVFPAGEPGIFMALGYEGLVRGYQLLYRIRGDTVELVESRIANVTWGTYDFEQPTKIELLCLLDCNSDKNRTIIKVVGAGHAGTGLFASGIFELIQITDEGLQTVFQDYEENWVVVTLPGSYHETYRYEYIDVESNPNKVIVKRGQSCDVMTTNDPFGLKDVNCISIMRRFSFDGMKYH